MNLKQAGATGGLAGLFSMIDYIFMKDKCGELNKHGEYCDIVSLVSATLISGTLFYVLCQYWDRNTNDPPIVGEVFGHIPDTMG